MGKLRSTIPAWTLACAAVAALGARAQAAPRATNRCESITLAALRACRAGVQDDRWIALGKCDNIADAAATKACSEKASTDARDALQTCREQRDLRHAACARLGPAPYQPVIDPANFVTQITNPYFPLEPGTTFVYEGQTADGFEHVEFAVTHTTRVILGVTCVEVHDTRKLNNKVLEDTRDWFAQDKAGNVWYFGENTAIVDERGLPIDLKGTWTAGVDGAQPGLIMKAMPMVGDFYRQEFLLGEAEDLAEVKSLSETVTVPFPPGTFPNSLETEESSPLKPGDVEHKFYAKNVGNLLTIDLATGERSELVQILKNQP